MLHECCMLVVVQCCSVCCCMCVFLSFNACWFMSFVVRYVVLLGVEHWLLWLCVVEGSVSLHVVGRLQCVVDCLLFVVCCMCLWFIVVCVCVNSFVVGCWLC